MREVDFVVMGFAYEYVVCVSSNIRSFFSKGKHLFGLLLQEETGSTVIIDSKVVFEQNTKIWNIRVVFLDQVFNECHHRDI